MNDVYEEAHHAERIVATDNKLSTEESVEGIVKYIKKDVSNEFYSFNKQILIILTLNKDMLYCML